MLYTLNLHSTICQVYLNKIGRRKNKPQNLKLQMIPSVTLIERSTNLDCPIRDKFRNLLSLLLDFSVFKITVKADAPSY